MSVDVNLVAILQKSTSPDQNELKAAQEYLEQAALADITGLLEGLSSVLADVKHDPIVRMQAGLQLKNALYSKDGTINKIYQQRWLQFPNEQREVIKTNCLSALGTEATGRGSAAQCVAYIACAELPAGQWLDVMRHLCGQILQEGAIENIKHANLEAIGYICQDINPAILVNQSNEILTAIMHGMKKEEPSENVRLSATTALLNSLEFTKHNFEIESERNYIMTVVCEATQSTNGQVRTAALQCLVKIMSLYYSHMETYMGRALFAITYAAMNDDNPNVALQGIEFWSTVCDEEIDLALEASECLEKGTPPSVSSKFYAKGALEHIAPILMHILAQQDENADDDEWNPNKAAGVCLVLLAQCCEDSIVPLVIPFVNANIKNENWRLRDAAVMAFGSILEGPNTGALTPLVESAMPCIIELLGDPISAVRDTAAWTLGRVCELLPSVALKECHLVPLLGGLVNGLASSDARVAANVCWALSSLAENAYDSAAAEHTNLGTDGSDEPATYALSVYFNEISQKLLDTSNRQDGAQHNLRNAAYSALMALIRSAARDCYVHVQQLTVIVLERLEAIIGIESQVVSHSDRAQFNDLQSLLCGTLQSVLHKISKQDALAIADKVMAALMSMFQSVMIAAENSAKAKELSKAAADGKTMLSQAQSEALSAAASNEAANSGVAEDALLAVSALLDAVGEEHFVKYLPAFMPVLIACLRLCEDTQVCLNAVGLLGDMCRTLSQHLLPQCDTLFTILMEILQYPNADKSIRPAILSTFGDLAQAVGPGVLPYLPHLLETLRQATEAEIGADDQDMLEYLNSLRLSCIEAYTGIVQGCKGENNADVARQLQEVKQHVYHMISYVQFIGKDDISDEIISACCGLIGDLVTTFGADISMMVDNEQLADVLTKGRRCKNVSHKRNAMWATREVKKLRNIVQAQALAQAHAATMQGNEIAGGDISSMAGAAGVTPSGSIPQSGMELRQ